MNDDELTKDMTGWLQSQDLDAMADYVRRGRQFSEVALPDLIAQWAVTFKDPDEYMRSSAVRNLTADYMAEFKLRGIDPPMEVVRANFVKIQKAIKKAMKSMSKEIHDDFAADLADDLDEFRRQRDREQH